MDKYWSLFDKEFWIGVGVRRFVGVKLFELNSDNGQVKHSRRDSMTFNKSRRWTRRNSMRKIWGIFFSSFDNTYS
jgi:hypothetical protein